MIDFENRKERETLMNETHELCLECKGHGFYMDSLGNENKCSKAEVHKKVQANLEYGMEAAAEYKHLQDTNVELFEAQTKFSEAITDLTVQLERIAEATKNAWTPLSEIRKLVDEPVTGGTLNEIRSHVLREAIMDLHYPMDGFEEKCICGEPWDDLEETCPEARRVIRYADHLQNGDEDA